MNKCSAIAEQLPQQPEIKTKQKFNHNVNMHSLSLLRIDYYGIVYRELFAVSIRARLCVAFMWPTCFAIRYDVCRVFHMKTWRIFSFIPFEIQWTLLHGGIFLWLVCLRVIRMFENCYNSTKLQVFRLPMSFYSFIFFSRSLTPTLVLFCFFLCAHL